MFRQLLTAALFWVVASGASCGGVASFRYFRFTPVKLRNGAAANSVQMSELRLYLDGVQRTGATASNPGGNNPGAEGPGNLVDNATSTKWLDFNRQPAILTFPSVVSVDSYRWATANDATERDPIRWTLEGSLNGVDWTLMDDRSDSDQAVTTSRRALLATLELNQFPDTPQVTYAGLSDSGIMSDEAIGILDGESVALNWEVIGANTITLNGIVVGASAGTVVTPSVTTDYTLTATNAFGDVPTTIRIYVVDAIDPPTINEFAASQSRDGILCDIDGDPSDWIELYNPNPFAVDVGGYGLTDAPIGGGEIWLIPEITIMEPNGYLVVFASAKEAVDGELRASFSLDRDGEYLGLIERDHTTVIQEFSPQYPPQDEDVSYGWTGSGYDFFTGPTPGAVNDTPVGPLAGDVVFETPPQTFVTSVQVVLSTVEVGGVIRYTTDGSLPDEDSTVYSGAIALTDSALVRAQVYATGKAPGEVKAEGYFRFSTTARNQTSDLPIVVIDNFDGGSIPNNVDLQDAYFKLFEPDPATGRTSMADLPTKANRMGIKRRGSSTLNDPKGNYRVEFWQDGSEEDRSVNLLGMSDHDEWILFAPYRFDRSLVRIPFIHGLSNDIETYASKSRLVELYVNTNGRISTSDYQGVYVLQERISRDRDRVDVERLDKNDTEGNAVTGGYILSIDRLDSGDQGFRSAMGHPFDPPNGSPQPWFTYVYPKEQNILPQQANYIRGYVDDLESALYGPNFKDPDQGYRAWLDVEKTIDHHILTTFTKDPDGLRLSTYLYKPRDGKLTFGPIWDFDRTMGNDSDSRSANPTGWNPNPERAEFFDYDYWGRLFDDEDFMQDWIDRWQKLRRGEFANAALRTRLDGLAGEVAESQPRNTAKWPEVAPNGGPFSGLGGWAGEVDHLKEWVTRRADWIDTQFVEAPFLQESGLVSAGDTISASAPEGTLYYTADGSDPRLPGGGVSPGAQVALNGITIDSSATVIVRSRQGDEWSGRLSSTFVVGVPASDSNLVISEIMYHPAPLTASEINAGFADESDFEFLEVQNVSEVPVVLTGAVFSGVFDLAIGDYTIPAGGIALIVRNQEAFEARYSAGLPIAGVYGDPDLPDGGQKLSNGGEQLVLTGVTGSIIRDFSYDDDPQQGWPPLPDGEGSSLVLAAPLSLPDHSSPFSWRASFEGQGSPGLRTDGVYEEWVVFHFSKVDQNNPAVSDPNADPDGDGIENLLELGLGGGPFEASNDLSPIAAIETLDGVPQPGNYLTVRATISNEVAGLIAEAELTDDLSDWSERAILHSEVDLGNGFSELVFRDLTPIVPASSRRFVRLRIILE